jgi:transposase
VPAANTQPEKLDKESLAVLDAVKPLIAAGNNDGVLALVSKLITTHARQLRAALEQQRRRAKNEGVSGAQLELIFAELSKCIDENAKRQNDKLRAALKNEQSQEAEEAKTPRQQPPRRRALPNLPIIDNPIAVPAAERPCPECGNERVCIGHDVTDVIDIEPARAIIRRDKREKLACKSCEGELVRAPAGDKVVGGGGYGARLVSEMVTDKYDDGLPLERQRQRFGRLGLDIPSSTLGDQITWATDLLAPVARALFQQTLDADVMHLDATSIDVLDRDTPSGIKTGSLWGYVGVDATRSPISAVYLYASTAMKNGQEDGELGPEDVLSMRRLAGKPHVVADAAGTFDFSFKQPGLIEVGCNMHARRYFAKALDSGDDRAALPIGAFKTLYDIEESIRALPIDEVTAQRRARSRPLYDELLAWCAAHKPAEPPKSLLGAALRYITNHRAALTRFLEDGRLPIDNGIVERLHRRPAMGRRAYLFAGSDAGARRGAIAYTVLGTCRLLGVNPNEYLTAVLPKLARGITVARDIPALMPLAWSRSR